MKGSRFLYHSFPRRYAIKRSDTYTKGESILSSIIEYGLLLTPELITWRNHWPINGQHYNFTYVQQRACFTELSRKELEKHATLFGEYAIELSIEAGRELGAIPVFYIPTSKSADDLSDIGTKMIHNLGQIMDILNDLETFLEIDKPNARTHMAHNNKLIDCSTKSAVSLVNSLFEHRSSPRTLGNFLYAFLGHFYPTENLDYTEPLAYYQQREWRISGRLTHFRGPVVVDAPAKLKTELMKIDKTFFSKMIQYKGFWSISEKSLIYQELNGRDLFSFVNSIFCPKNRISSVEHLIERKGRKVRVLPL